MTTRRAVLALVSTGLLALPSAASAGASRYIVVLKDSADSAQVARDHGRAFGAEVSHVYRAALKGYAAAIPAARLDAVRDDRRVAYVERDQVATAVAQTIPWGITKVEATLSSTLAGNGSGAVSGVTSYVIDSGVARHADIDRVNHVNFAGGKNDDCNGHGTHVAGTVAAIDNTDFVVGVAPGAATVGVKVLGCNGSGSYSGVIAGVDWVTANSPGPAVANMSLGGPVSAALDDAIRKSVASGVFYAVAAGNDGANACNYSPARLGTEPGVMSVGATDSADREASFSNFGSCVDVWAPGVDVLSTSKSGGTTTFSGTSMASPHVAGGAALYLSRNATANPAGVETAIASAATNQAPNDTTADTLSKDGRVIERLDVSGF